jgi:hypothetical protein
MGDAPMTPRSTALPASLVLAAALAAPAALADPAGIDAVVGRSTCARHPWPGRGVAPPGYMRGMGRVYAKAWCDLRRPKSVAAGLAGADFEAGTDALALYGKARGTPQERLRALYALALGEGMRESTGNASAGVNRAVRHRSASVAEAGLFQVMPNTLHDSPWLPQLYDQYRAHPAACLRETFMDGAKDRRQPVLGQGPQAEFQRFTKACPAFAVEYATVVLRTDRRKFPPVQHHRAQLLPACEDMFAEIERVAADGCGDGPDPGAHVEGPASAPTASTPAR